jgi:hypothetical protein
MREAGRIYRAVRRGALHSTEAQRMANLVRAGLEATRAAVDHDRMERQELQIAELSH